jgi:hypothetical protein
MANHIIVVAVVVLLPKNILHPEVVIFCAATHILEADVESPGDGVTITLGVF